MAFWNFKRGQSSDLNNTPVVDGTFRFTSDNSKLYVDDGATRKAINPNPDWNASSGNAIILNKPTRLSQFNNDLGIDGIMRFKDIVIDSVTATQNYDRYSYIYTYAQQDMTPTTYMKGFLLNFDYSKAYAVESVSNAINILFEDEPTTPIVMRVYAFDTNAQNGMMVRSYSITNVASSTTYSDYPYVFHVNLDGVVSTSYVDIELLTDIGAINYAVESVTNGINIYFSGEPSSYPVNVNVYIYLDIVHTSTSEDLLYFTYRVTSVDSLSGDSLYSYKCTISYTGIDATTNVDINIDPSDYAGNYAIESDTNSLIIYFSTQPTLPLTAKVWLQKATSLVQS